MILPEEEVSKNTDPLRKKDLTDRLPILRHLTVVLRWRVLGEALEIMKSPETEAKKRKEQG